MKPAYNFSLFLWVKGTTTGWLIAAGGWELLLRPTFIRIGLSGNGQYPANLNQSFDTNTWYHLGFTWNGGTGELKLYLNGSCVATSNVPSSANFSVNSSLKFTYDGPRYLNDVRIYDHCLSPKEVEEIAKGLVLHYRLDYYWLAENLLINTHFDNRYSQTTGWDTAKNGTLLANSWGGYNSGVANQATVYHAHLKEVNGEYVYEYIKDANNSWLGISQGGLQSKLTAGTKYTFSWEQYCVSGSNYVNTGLYYYKTGASSASFHLGYAYGNSGRVTGQWQKFTYTFTAPSDADYAKNMSWYVYGAQGGNGTFYARHFKLEKGDKATPWSPAKTDTLYTALEYDSTTVYDSSGYSNNGTIVGSLTAAAGSPRYDVAMQFSTAGNYIHTYLHNFTSPIAELTFSCWCYLDSIVAYPASSMLFKDESSIGYNTSSKLNGMLTEYPATNTSMFFRMQHIEIQPHTWFHLVLTFNHGILSGYLNGEKKDTLDYSATFTQIILDEGSDNLSFNNIGCPWDGKLSDFRMYMTSLTDDQVKELYNTSMSIDSNGNVYARELSEL